MKKTNRELMDIFKDNWATNLLYVAQLSLFILPPAPLHFYTHLREIEE